MSGDEHRAGLLTSILELRFGVLDIELLHRVLGLQFGGFLVSSCGVIFAYRRKAGPLINVHRREFAGGHIDRDTHEVIVRGERAELTPREFNLLWALADRPGRVVTHESLLEQVWGPAHRHDLDYLRVAIRSLRRKLEVAPATPRLLINEPGVGYRVAET